jgi:hypothetical protein
MNVKMFLFWSGVVALGIMVAYVLIEWLREPTLRLVSRPRREIGFHSIKAELEAEAVAA